MFIPLHDDNPLINIRFQYVTVAVIAACAVVFAYQVSLGDRADQAFVFAFGAIPAVIFGKATLPHELAQIPAALSLVTSMFLHGGFMHLAGNMLFLWVLGDNVEDALGHKRFLVFYLIAGIAAALAHGLTDPGSKIPMVGASGAISGVIGAYLVLHPKARIKVLVSFFLVWLPAWVVLGFWIGLQVLSAATETGGAGGGVAWWAHIGGFVAGAILIIPMRRKGVPIFDRNLKKFEMKMSVESNPRGRSRIPSSGGKPRRRGPWGDRGR
ncbi:MAG: rhomboid family intramembrane serine protease [Rhodospirillales bacterium]|nr:rhomboid family intramembrane serine protease [Rhodospirillales bacterium]